MKISLVTPAGKQSRGGNRVTAVRWARMLHALGHLVTVSEADDGSNADMMIAVHAWRSADSIRRFADMHPDRPLVVVLAGTDIYRFQDSHPAETHASMERADRLVCLHNLVHRAIPEAFRAKLRVIHQSAPSLPGPRQPASRTFEVCVIGHLREEKDPMRAALAARKMPHESRLRIIHLGRAHDETWVETARREIAENRRYIWRGEVPGWKVRRQFARSHAMVISSTMEGGANVVSEAVAAGLPVIASRIDGNVGLLGEDYTGYYPVQDTDALAAILWRAETNPDYLSRLAEQVQSRTGLFAPAREQEAWKSLLTEITSKAPIAGS